MESLSICPIPNLKTKFPENITFFTPLTIPAISLAIRKVKLQFLDNLINYIIVLVQ